MLKAQAQSNEVMPFLFFSLNTATLWEHTVCRVGSGRGAVSCALPWYKTNIKLHHRKVALKGKETKPKKSKPPSLILLRETNKGNQCTILG